MNIILLAILLLYQTGVSLLDIRDIKELKNKEINQEVKLRFYKESIFFGWIPVIIIIVFIFLSPLNLNDIGIRQLSLSDNFWINVLTLVICIAIVIILVYQIVMYLVSEEYRVELAKEVDKESRQGSYYERITFNLITPVTMKEKKWFFFVSLTAGICEEIVWRGCMLLLLSSIFPDFNVVIVSVISCLLFGIFHCYQGFYGMIKTAVIAFLFVLIYITTNSLLLGIILHFLFDFSSAFLTRE